MSNSQPIELRHHDAYSFRNSARTAFIMGLLAVAAGCSAFAFLIPAILIITPAIVDRSKERCAMCLLEGVAILFLVAMPIATVIGTMDSRGATPAVWQCVPSIQYFNPAFNDSGIPYQWRALICFTGFTGFCYLRMAARLYRKHNRIVMIACLCGTAVASLLFPFSWAAAFPGQWTPLEETYGEYFLSHLLLGLTWGTGGMVTAYVATKLLHQKPEQQRDHTPAA